MRTHAQRRAAHGHFGAGGARARYTGRAGDNDPDDAHHDDARRGHGWGYDGNERHDGRREWQRERGALHRPGGLDPGDLDPGGPDPAASSTAAARAAAAATTTPTQIAGDEIYCTTAEAFTADLHTPPQIALVTTTLPTSARAGVQLSLSKIATVHLTVRLGGTVVYSNSATVERGKPKLLWPTPAKGGSYAVTLTATDLAGNFATAAGRSPSRRARRRAEVRDPGPAAGRRPRLRCMTRLSSAWRALTPDQRLAGAASAALFVTMFLPWYQQNAVVNAPRAAPLQSRNLNAFQVFSFVEAAVLLVAVAVLYLLFARGERRSFQLPGGDGTVVLAAGVWVGLLLILRLFDKPGITTHGVAANVGIQWGIFFALAAAGLLAVAGSRMRAGSRPEPPLLRRPRRTQPPRQPEPPPMPPPRRVPRRPVSSSETTEQLSFEDPVPGPEQR